MASNSIFSKIKVGDTIVIWSGSSFGEHNHRKAYVIGTTKTQITIKRDGMLPTRFTKSKGKEVGGGVHTGARIATVLEKVPGETFRHRDRLMTVDEMVAARLKDNAKLRKARILTAISRVSIDDVTVGNLVEAAEILGLEVN